MINDRQLIDEIKKLVSNAPIVTGFFNGNYFIGDNNKIYDNLIIPDNRNGKGIIVYWEEKNSWLLILSGAKNTISRQNIISNRHRRYIQPINNTGNLKILYTVIDSLSNASYYVGGYTKSQSLIYSSNNNSNQLYTGIINNYGNNNNYVVTLNGGLHYSIVNIKNNNILFKYVYDINNNNFINSTDLGLTLNPILNKVNYYYKGNLIYCNQLNNNNFQTTTQNNVQNCNGTNLKDFIVSPLISNYYTGSGHTEIAFTGTGSNGYCYTLTEKIIENFNTNIKIPNINKDNYIFLPQIISINGDSYSDNSDINYSSLISNYYGSYTFTNFVNNSNNQNNGFYNVTKNITTKKGANNNRIIKQNYSYNYNTNYLLVDWKYAQIINTINISLNGNFSYSESRDYYQLTANSITNESNFYLESFNKNIKLNSDSALVLNYIDIENPNNYLNIDNNPNTILWKSYYSDDNRQIALVTDYLNNYPQGYIGNSINFQEFNNQNILIGKKNNNNKFTLVKGIINSISINRSHINEIYVFEININISVISYEQLDFISFATESGTLISNNGSIHAFINKNDSLLFDKNANNRFIDYTEFQLKNYIQNITLGADTLTDQVFVISENNYIFYTNDTLLAPIYANCFIVELKGTYGNYLSNCTFKNNKIFISYISNDIKTKDTKYFVEVWNVTSDGKILYSDNLISGIAYNINNTNANILSTSYFQ